MLNLQIFVIFVNFIRLMVKNLFFPYEKKDLLGIFYNFDNFLKFFSKYPSKWLFPIGSNSEGDKIDPFLPFKEEGGDTSWISLFLMMN